MSQPQMRRRCPGAQYAGGARLDGWQLMITNRGAANIIKSPNHSTQGVLWRFEPRHIGMMDIWEGVARRVYRRIWITVTPLDRATDLEDAAADDNRLAGTGLPLQGAGLPLQGNLPAHNTHLPQKSVTALTYVCVSQWPGRARPGYVETAMLPGAVAAGLSQGYRQEIQSWLPDRPLGAARPYRGRRTKRRAKMR